MWKSFSDYPSCGRLLPFIHYQSHSEHSILFFYDTSHNLFLCSYLYACLLCLLSKNPWGQAACLFCWTLNNQLRVPSWYRAGNQWIFVENIDCKLLSILIRYAHFCWSVNIRLSLEFVATINKTVKAKPRVGGQRRYSVCILETEQWWAPPGQGSPWKHTLCVCCFPLGSQLMQSIN